MKRGESWQNSLGLSADIKTSYLSHFPINYPLSARLHGLARFLYMLIIYVKRDAYYSQWNRIGLDLN